MMLCTVLAMQGFFYLFLDLILQKISLHLCDAGRSYYILNFSYCIEYCKYRHKYQVVQQDICYRKLCH